MRKKLATLLITSSLIINSCIKSRSSQDVLVDSMVASKETQTFVVGSNSNKESPIPQKVFLTAEERINWLNSQRVKSALEDFDKFKQLLPEIAEFIGRALQDCKTYDCMKDLAAAIAFIADRARPLSPYPPRYNFDFIGDDFDVKHLYYRMLSKKDVSADKKLGVLALMLFTNDITSALRHLLPDGDDIILPGGFSKSILEKITQENPNLRKPIEFLITTFEEYPDLLIEEIPVIQLRGLRDVFLESNKNHKAP